MKTNEFIKEHIKFDERLKISKKLNLLSKKYSEFGYYLDMIQKESIGKLFVHLQINNFLIQSMVKEDIKIYSFKHYINVLCVNNFLEVIDPSEKQFELVSELYNGYVADKINYYGLTKKGKDFLNIDIVKEYLKTEYEEYRNEFL